jgi:hypothetical protein
MSKSIFDLVNDITFNKTAWSEQSDVDKKQFSPYMMNRIVSMDYTLIEFVNYIQQYTPILSNENVYNVYLDVLPKKKMYNKYIGNKTENKQQKLIDFIMINYQLNERETKQLLTNLTNTELIQEIMRYGYTEKEIKKEYGL